MRSLDPELDKKLVDLIRRQPVTGMTDAEVAEVVGCARRTVSNRKKQIADKYLKEQALKEAQSEIKSRNRELMKRARPKDLIAALELEKSAEFEGKPGPKSILDAFPESATLTPEESMKLLSILAREAPPAVQVQAIKNLEDLRRINAPPASLGPPAPMTDQDKVSRLARLMDALGPTLTRQAVEEAFPPEPDPYRENVEKASAELRADPKFAPAVKAMMGLNPDGTAREGEAPNAQV